jgi:predicted PurR-regulated permease PerM
LQLDKKTVRYIFLGAAGCVLLYWVLHEPERIGFVIRSIYRILSPFLFGAALAFVLNVPMRGIEGWLKPVKKDGLRRFLAISLTVVSILLVLGIVLLLLIPQLATTIDSLMESLPGFCGRMITAATEFLEANPQLRDLLVEYTDFENMDLSSVAQQAIATLSGVLGKFVGRIFEVLVSFLAGTVDAVLSLIFALYCLFRKEILARQGRRLLYAFVPEKAADETVRILRMTNTTFSCFISGQCLEAVILGCMFAVSMAVFRMPFIPLVSLIIAVTALVPIVGSFVGCILGALFILVRDPMLAVWFVVLFLALQQIEGNLIYPRVVGSSIGLPGMWVLVAVAVGGDLMGVGGMLVMIPAVSVLYALACEITNKRLAAKGVTNEKLQDHPPEIVSKFRLRRSEKYLLKKTQEASVITEDQKGDA